MLEYIKEYIMINKKIIIKILIIIAIILIIQIVLNLFNDKNKILLSSYIKNISINEIENINISCDLNNTISNNKIPYFKVNGDAYNLINNQILEDVLLRACYQNGYVDYDISYNDDILSLIIYISYETTGDMAYTEYKTYNINTKTNNFISNQDILNKYNITVEDVNNKVIDKFKEFYQYEKKNNLLDSNITFDDYLNILEFHNINLNNMKLYIDKKNDLYVSKEYNLSEGMRLDQNFPELIIKFKLT